VLALPFAVVILGTHGLSQSFSAFQGGDEPVHYQIVQAVLHQWPRPLLGGYASWEGPLLYWLLATLSLPFGGSLVAVRLVVAAFSWATCAVAYVLFRDRLHARAPDALALALLLAISPFFFGQSFHVLTDNPTWFCVVLGMERLLAYAQRPKPTRIAAFAACLAAATMMRQVSLWLLAPGLAALLGVPASRRSRIAGAGFLLLAVVPLGALLAYWGGPLPPAPGGGAQAQALLVGHRLRNVVLSLGVVGMYGVLVLPLAELAGWWRRLRDRPGWLAAGALPAVGTLGLLGRGLFHSNAAFFSLISRLNVPQLAGASLLWWLLVPLGTGMTVALVLLRHAEVTSRVVVVALLGLLVSATVNVRWFERYVDFPTLLLIAALSLAGGAPLGRADRLRWLLAGLLAIASFVWLA
jgi:4-amino-4-deoxy-L-arabinose transferase-like glycosyltransferase